MARQGGMYRGTSKHGVLGSVRRVPADSLTRKAIRTVIALDLVSSADRQRAAGGKLSDGVEYGPD